MHLIALVTNDDSLALALGRYRPDGLPFHLHPLPPGASLERAAQALEPLGFAGMLVLDANRQGEAFALADRSSLDAQEVQAADALAATPGGLVAEFNFGRAIGCALEGIRWNPRDASVVVMGSGPRARATSRELASRGVRHLAVLAANQPAAEQTTRGLAATAELSARAHGDPLAEAMLERADLLVRIDARMRPPSHLLGPHLTTVDLCNEPLSELRRQAMDTGAATLGIRDVQAQQLALSVGHILGGRLEASAFANLLHSL